MVNISKVLLHPYVTEKTMNYMAGTPTQDYKDGNKIEFVVLKTANKGEIKAAFEAHFDVKVKKVWTRSPRTESAPRSSSPKVTRPRTSE